MKLAKRLSVLIAILAFASLFVACDFPVGEWLSAPYGYVQTSEGVAVSGATVTVYITSVSATNKVQSSAVTTSTGYFSLSSKVDTVGGTYIVVVEPPATNSSLQFDNLTVEVPSTGYLYNIGTIKAVGGFYNISGKVINARVKTQTNAIPTSGKVSIRQFGGAEIASTTTIASDGSFSISGIESGDYLVEYTDSTIIAVPSVADPNWFGIPVSLKIAGANLVDVGALVYNTTSMATGDILLIATWENKNYDIDSYSIIGPVGAPEAAVGFNYSGAIAAIGRTPANAYNTSGNDVIWERDVMQSEISSTTSPVFPAETTLVRDIADGTEMRFYVRCFTLSGSISGLEDTTSVQPAGVTVYAMYLENLQTSYHFGTWFAPLDTAEKIVGMAELVGGVTINADSTLDVLSNQLTIGSFGWLDKYRNADGSLNYDKAASPRALLTGGVVVSSIR